LTAGATSATFVEQSMQTRSFQIAPSVCRQATATILNPVIFAMILVLLSIWTTAGQSSRTNSTRKIYRDRVEPHWLTGNDRFWYRVDLADDAREFLLIDAVQGKRGPAFDHERLAKALSEQTSKTVQAIKLPVESIKFSDDGKSMVVTTTNESWDCDLDSYRLTKHPPEEKKSTSSEPATAPERRRRRPSAAGPPVGVRSPDGAWEALVRGHNLYLRDVKAGTEKALTYDANPTDSYARDAQRDRAIEMEYDTREPESPMPDVSWAPDSHSFVALRTKAGTQRTVYEVESSPEDQLQPKLQSYPYLKPGDDVPIRKPHLFDVEAAKEIPVSDALFLNPWSIQNVRWSTNSQEFTFEFNQRGHQVFRILAVNAKTGDVRTVVDEQCPTFFCYSGKFFVEYLDATKEIIWMSERDGWNHLYLYDATTGKVKNQITKEEWVVRKVEKVDPDKRLIWFSAGGIRPGEDPYYVHYCRVKFDGTGLEILTEGDGNHTASFSPDHRFLVDTWSRVDLPPSSELRSCEDGHLVCELEKADATALFAGGWKAPERFVAKGRDGATDIYGIIYRPKNFDPKGKYPIIEEIYAGPQDSFVPKSFRASYRYDDLASRGFIIVQVDGMGTSNRSKKFHDVCWKNLVDAGLPDRILWIKAAAAKYPYIDLERVGVYGGSAGGQSALGALLTHGDFYKAAAADCGCHDNRMDKIWWNEQWMGWPIGPWYEEQSNVTLAHNLKGKLLLTVAELDRNVDPSSTMQVVNALIKANKDFELIVFPGGGHGSGSSPYGNKRRIEFFVRNLLGADFAANKLTAASGGN
jgi:dipeptidyl aminopeptidase/acylaminoacyl peptidase